MSTCGNNASNESVVNKWNRVKNGGKVLVCLSVRCKIVEETDEGALLLDGTAVQRIVYSDDAPNERPQESIGFTMKQKGPTKTQLESGGEPSWELRQGIGRLSEQKFALQKCPLENFEHSHSILQATIDLDLQDLDLQNGSRKFHPELCVSDSPATPDQGMVRSKPSRLPTKLTRRKRSHIPLKSRRLAFVRDHPTAEIIPSTRNQGTYSGMRLTFYMHEPPTRIVFKVIGPFCLVLMLMLLNFQEFYGPLNAWGGCTTSEEDRDSDYLANGIGIAITAVFVFPSTNSGRAKSAYTTSTSDYDDYLTMVFLVGLTLATVPQCQVARSGCVISFSVVSVTLVSLVVHWIRCKKIKLKDSVRVREETSTSGRQQQEVQFKLNDWKQPSSYERRKAKHRKVWGLF